MPTIIRALLGGLLVMVLLAPVAHADALRDLERTFEKEKGQPYAVRFPTVQKIAALKTDEAARFLLRVIEEDDDTSIRLNTIHSVARMPQGFVFDRLLGYVRLRDTSLRSTAFHAITTSRSEALPEEILAEVLAGHDQGMRTSAVRYLARHEDARFAREAERFLDAFPKSASSLTSILLPVKTPVAARLLLRVYDDTRIQDRERIPKMFADADPHVRAVLIEALSSNDRSRILTASRVIARAKVTEAEDALVLALPPEDPELRARLLETLGALGAASAEARRAILDALEATNAEVQAAAARAVRLAPFREAVLPLVACLDATKDRLVAAETALTLEGITGQQYGDRADLWRRWWAEYGDAFDLGAVKKPAEGTLPQVLVDLAIERGAAALKRVRHSKPPWKYANHPMGTTALVVLALDAAGFDRKDKDVKAGVAYLVKAPIPETTYDTGLVAMALEAATGKRHRRRIAECARRLIATQNDAGLWGYPSGNGDNSNTQYAVLGLRAAARVGIRVPQRVWKAVRDHFLAARGKDGGWAYPIRNVDHSSASMTAAGVCCLLVCLERMKLDEAEAQVLTEAIETGYQALGTLMKIDRDSLYALYGIERAGVLGGRATMAGHPWYPPGARRLVEEQGRDGFWKGTYDRAVDTAFAILFLKRATVPVALAVTTK